MAIALEYTDLTSLGMDPDNPQATELISACAAVLFSNALDPSRCRLVITGDFIRSTRQRLPEGPYRDNFHLNRSTGLVAGKTITLPDGTIDVLLHDFLFTL